MKEELLHAKQEDLTEACEQAKPDSEEQESGGLLAGEKRCADLIRSGRQRGRFPLEVEGFSPGLDLYTFSPDDRSGMVRQAFLSPLKDRIEGCPEPGKRTATDLGVGEILVF